MRLKYISAHRAKDLKRTVLVISSMMLSMLKSKREIKLSEMFSKLNDSLSIHQKDYVLALNFLYALGAIEYDKNKDAIRYLK